MNRFAELIKSVSAMPSVIVHLGAGNCSEYDSYKAINSDRVIYVEPDQYLAEAATDTFNNTSHVKVIPRAIAAKNGRQTLNITNNRRFSSLLLPSELLDFYPNIEVDDNAEVEAITLTKLCQDEEVSKDSDNLLVAELQGMEKEVFPSAEIETLQRFKWIIIRSSEINLYTLVSDNTQRSLSEAMQDAGFMVLVFKEDAPPFVNILCIRNDATIENTQLKTHEADLLDTIRVLEHNLAKQIADLGALQTNGATAMAELQLSLNSKSDELGKVRSLMQSVTVKKKNQQRQINNLASAVEAKTAELDTAQTLIESITAEKESQQQQINDLSDTIEAKSVELDKAQDLIETITAEKENQQQQLTTLTDSIKEKEKEISGMHQTLRINNKLILKSDTDLRDLQLQYRAALQHQEQQHTLLCELKKKLSQASEFYQKLNLKNLVLDADLLEQSNSGTVESHTDDED